jgi:nucleotidyltransferase/DNA polymerase involved in DNA repair
MPLREAYRLCPEGVFLPVRAHRYLEVSRQIMAILRQEAARVEPVSVDEAYLDLEGPIGEATVARARRIKERIRDETGLTASLGLAPNKMLAKVASELNKPDGFTVVPPEAVDQVLLPLSVRSIPGIGPKTATELAALGIRTMADLRAADAGLLNLQFGRRAGELLRLAHGQDDRPVEPVQEARSLAAETTFAEDVADLALLRRQLTDFAQELWDRVSAGGLRARTVTVKVRFADFKTVSRSQTRGRSFGSAAELGAAALTLLRRVERRDRVRLVGLEVSGFSERSEPEQLRFDFAAEREDRGSK